MSPTPSLRDRFFCFLHSFPDPRVFGLTPHHSVSTTMQRSFSDLAAPPVRYVPRGMHRIQPSYCFRGATATHWFSDLLRPLDSRPKDPSRACDTRLETGVRVRLWSFGSPISGRARDLDPTSRLPARGHLFKLPHTRALLLPFSFAGLLEGSGCNPRFRLCTPL